MMSNRGKPIAAHIVDDDLPIRELLSQMLRNIGFGRVINSSSIHQALHQRADSVCDVYFVDIELGDGNGLDLIATINDQYPLAKVIVFSGKTTPENVNAASSLKVNGFLVKPFSLKSLVRVLHHSNLLAAVA